jgi:ABC-type transporter Mla subunit MlaD
MIFKKDEPTITSREVVSAIQNLKQFSREVEVEIRNVLEVCQRARKVDGDIFKTSQALAGSRDTTETLKLSGQLAALVEQRQKMDGKIDSLTDAGGELGRKLNQLADDTLVQLGVALRKLSALHELNKD